MSNHFSIAVDAKQYVRDQMMVKAANRPADSIEANAFDSAEQTKGPLEDQIGESGVRDDGLIDCLAWAAVAQRSRISNCLGMASLALAWIALKHPAVRPIGVYGFKGSTLDDDGGAATLLKHTMAVTGKVLEMNQAKVEIRNGVRSEVPVFTADHAICIVGDPRLDGLGRVTAAGAFVCDPWARRVHDATGLDVESALLANVTGGSVRLSPLAVLHPGQTMTPGVQQIIGIT